jgi:hypothetical protein
VGLDVGQGTAFVHADAEQAVNMGFTVWYPGADLRFSDGVDIARFLTRLQPRKQPWYDRLHWSESGPMELR